MALISRVAIFFDADALSVWAQGDERNNKWAVVYALSADNAIYVGETTNTRSQ